MKSLFDINNPAMTFLKKCGNLMIANLLWVLCSIPIITMGASTAALYYVCFKVINDEEPYIVRSYFAAFKENFKQATIIWLVLFVILAVTVFEVVFVFRLPEISTFLKTILLCVFCLVLLAWFLVYIYVFALQAYFDNTVKHTVFNAVLFGISYYGYSILMIVANALLLYYGLLYAPIIVPVLPIMVNAYFIQKIITQHLPNADTDATESIEE